MTDYTTPAPNALIGSSAAMQRVRDAIGPAAASDAPLFLSGESGTGKDLVAQAIHAASPRAANAFVTLNGSGVPDDILDRELYGDPSNGTPAPYPSVPRYLAEAAEGTLFLDDIGRMSPVLQARILHLLTTGSIVSPRGIEIPFRARLIAATNTDLAEGLRTGRLRRDLYDRLSVMTIELPPLRSRNGDAGEIAAHVFPDLLARFGLPKEPLPGPVVARLGTLQWPGNVRQLLNVLRRMALSPSRHDLPSDVLAESRPEPGSADHALPRGSFAQIERRVILAAIARHGGSIQRAADELELAASTIYRKLKGWQTS